MVIYSHTGYILSFVDTHLLRSKSITKLFYIEKVVITSKCHSFAALIKLQKR